MSETTRILSGMDQGDPVAAERLFTLVYSELRQLAANLLARETPGQTLQPTALVHEAYLRLVDQEQPQDWKGRDYFFAACAQAMRRILVENARRKGRIRHGGLLERQELKDEVAPHADDTDEELLALDAALDRLAEVDPQKAKLVELRYFGGLSGDQVAAVLGISPSTADRHWVFARAWLRRELRGWDPAGAS